MHFLFPLKVPYTRNVVLSLFNCVGEFVSQLGPGSVKEHLLLRHLTCGTITVTRLLLLAATSTLVPISRLHAILALTQTLTQSGSGSALTATAPSM